MSDPATTLSDRPHGFRILSSRAAPTTAQRTRPTAPAPDPRDLERALLCRAEWLRLAVAPDEIPTMRTAYHYFRAWRLDGTWEYLNAALREQLRASIWRNPEPNAASSIASRFGPQASEASAATTRETRQWPQTP